MLEVILYAKGPAPEAIRTPRATGRKGPAMQIVIEPEAREWIEERGGRLTLDPLPGSR